ncbi:reverse transcriptase domain-containing protein, partial [Tanacetum coccineum]
MPQRLTKGSIYSRSLQLAACASLGEVWGDIQVVTGFVLGGKDGFRAWERFKDLLHACPHHGFTKLYQLDTFYNSLTSTDQDSLNAAAGGKLLTKTPKDALTLMENKSKVRTLRNRPVVAKVSTNTCTSGLSPDVAALTDVIKALLLKNTTPPPAFVKAVEETVVNYNQGNAGHHPPSVAHQVRPPGFLSVQNNQNRGNNYNKGNSTYRAPTQPTQVARSNELANYMKVNDTNMRAMQNQITNMKTELKNEFQATMLQQNNKLENMLSNYFQMNKPSGSGSLPSNIVVNLKGDLKEITTRSGVSYDGPPTPPLFSPYPKVVEREPEVTKDPVQPSTEKVQPPDVQTQAPTFEPVNVPKPKLNLPYPSRLNNQKLRERDDHQMMKFLQIFRSLHFDLSFTDALLYMPKFASIFKNLLSNKEKLFELANTPIVECLALADLGASINLMPLSIWRKLLLPELTPTQIILELVDRSTTRPTGIAEDVFVRVGKMARALIDVYGEELTLRVSDQAITFKVGNTSRYSYNDVESINRINVIDIACEEYSQEVLGFFDNSESGNPTPISKPIIAKSSPSLTPFEGGDFILEEIKAYLESDSVPPRIDDAEFDPEGDIRLIEEMLNKDSYSPLPLKDLKCEELKSVKSSVDEPSELELKDYLLISTMHFWRKLSDIKGIDPQFCTHKILMEDDFNPAVQHQRRINPKIHEVIKKEVVKLLDAGLIYPISDSPWVSPVHCVPKKGGMTIVTNEDNELIPTRLFTGWCVCIDYKKLNDATQKDHFSLPFMDQMLERLARNEYYCFLDGFSGYFQIQIDPQDQEKTTFTYPYGTFAYRCIPFGLCNAPGTFQRYKMLKRCEDTNLVLNWEKCHFMVKEGIVLDHKISKSRIEVDRANVDYVQSAEILLSALSYTICHSKARSWSIPSEAPYEEAAQHFIINPEPEHPADLRGQAEDEAPTLSTTTYFLALRIRPLCVYSQEALEVEMRDVASAYYHSLHPSGTPPLLPIPLPAPSTSCRADIPEADTPPRKRLLLTTP